MSDELPDGTITDLEKLESAFNELGVRYKLEGRNAGRKQLIKEDGKPAIETSIIVDQSCYRLKDGQDVVAKWDAYVCFFFYFDFDVDGKFIKCGADAYVCFFFYFDFDVDGKFIKCGAFE